MSRASSITSDGSSDNESSSKLARPPPPHTNIIPPKRGGGGGAGRPSSGSISLASTSTTTSRSQGFFRTNNDDLHDDDDDDAADYSSCQFSVSRKSYRTIGGGGGASSVAMSDASGDFSLPRPSVTSTLAPKARKSNDLSDFTINQLHFTSLGLHGREKEVQLLKFSLDKLLSSSGEEEKEGGEGGKGGNEFVQQLEHHQERQLILISGYSGTGKTTLANHALKNSTEQIGGLFVRGKFDLNLRNIPFSGIASACGEICGAILQLQIHKPNLFEQLCDQIKSELGSELALLIQVIPILAEVVDCDSSTPFLTTTETNNNGGGMSSGDSKNQFNFAFLRFIRTISYQFTPLIFVLDDLQWADGASLDLLDVLLTDSSISKLMVVGIYRSNEVDETHIFYRTIEDLEAKSKDKYFEMTQVDISNLEFEAVHKIIQDLLSIDSESQTLGLADVCYKKTHGNVFFLLQYLSMLKEYQLLQFNLGTVSWTWDVQEIETRTSASDNVVDLLKAKMAELSKDLIDILKLASCLGCTFEVRILNIVWERSMELTPETDDALKASLDRLEADGYILKGRSQSTHENYSWGHDKIQEAALTLVPESERGAFAAKVGRSLLSQLDETDLDSAIFVVVDLLNGGDAKLITDTKARLELAGLNHKASHKAISFSAFESAAEYAAQGIQLLPKNAWVDHYNLALNLHTIGAQAEGFIGNTETMEHYCKQVLSQEDRPIEDKFGVYQTWIDSMLNRRLLSDARDLSLKILKQFKCRFPKSSALIALGVIGNVVKIKATMKSRDVSKLSILKDTNRMELMNLLDKLATNFYIANDDRLPLVMFRSLNWTMKYGYCDYSPAAFATTGLILIGALNDLQGGSKYGEQALTLMERSNSQNTTARTMFLVHSFLFTWTKLARSLLKPLLRSYDIGLQTGDTESAAFAIMYWLMVKFQIGSSLEALEADTFLYYKQMKALKRDQAYCATQYMLQVLLNLLGHDNLDNPTHLVGNVLSEDELERLRNDKFFAPGVLSYEGLLFTYFGEHVRYADTVIKTGHDYLQKTHLASSNNMWNTFFMGVSCFAAARETHKKKYAKMGQIFRSKIKKWVDMGNPNVKHYELLLDAEFLAFKGKKVAAIKQYKSSILFSARGGYQHDAALAAERFGEFYLNVMGDKEEAVYQITESIKYWEEWGAMAKVHHLQNKYGYLMPQPTEIVAVSSVSSRLPPGV